MSHIHILNVSIQNIIIINVLISAWTSCLKRALSSMKFGFYNLVICVYIFTQFLIRGGYLWVHIPILSCFCAVCSVTQEVKRQILKLIFRWRCTVDLRFWTVSSLSGLSVFLVVFKLGLVKFISFSMSRQANNTMWGSYHVFAISCKCL